MQFKWKVGGEYKFKDIDGLYRLIGIDGKTNYKYAYAVFVNEKENKRMRIKEMVAKDLVLHESNA